MARKEHDDIPMLTEESLSSASKVFTSRNRSASLSIPMNRLDYYENETVVGGYTGPLRRESKTSSVRTSGPLFTNPKLATRVGIDNKVRGPKPERYSSFGVEQSSLSDEEYVSRNDHLLRSGQLGMCNDPYCTTCPSYYNMKAAQHKSSRVSSIFDSKFHNVLYGDAKGWAKRFVLYLHRLKPGIMNPHAKAVQNWARFFVLSCLLAIFVDPLFFFLLSSDSDKKCIIINWSMTKLFVVLRSMNDFIYCLNMLLQFRLAYVSPESTVVGAGELVDQPKEIARNYFRGKFLLDLFIVLPLPQILILIVIPEHLGSSGANYAKNLLRFAILLQYVPRLYRFLPLIAGQSPNNGFIFESAWANFVINLLTFVLAGHVVGSMWYLLGLQRVNQCLRNACKDAPYSKTQCDQLIDCGGGDKFYDSLDRSLWKQNENATACFQDDSFHYGIYEKAVTLTTKDNIVTRYIYSLFWGFQQISTLAGNQVPSYFVWEVLFTMGIIGLGLLLFALLIGNMQNFLQALGRRRLEMSLRRRDVEQWMSHRRLPEDLRRRVRQAERFTWAATRGVNEQTLFENLPEDLQIDIRRHLFNFIKKVRIFSLMDESILDAICERLRQRTYIRGSRVLSRGGRIEKMVFIVRGKMESIGEDGTILPLSEGYVCGEELLTWCLEHSTISRDGTKIRLSGKRLISSRFVTCVTNVEAFSLSVDDLEDVTSLFSRFLRNPRVQGAIRYESPYWRLLAATRIQVAWRYRKKRLQRTMTPQVGSDN